jgi:hypothetical protein
MKQLLLVGLLIAFCMVVSPVLAATITTDKPDYVPEEKVILNGTGFAVGNPVYITVTRPDGSTEPYSVEPNPVYPDVTGAFSAKYQLDGIQGTYFVNAKDSSGLIIAQTTFNDTVSPVPEFPSMALPIVMMIGIIGLVFGIKLREK